ncbi:LYR motif-containing protein 9 isoform X3 [Symphalangus syndactylus]|uniref:LYR motif-containing protein 9 isoform X3 n=1 Tax=Symphalangus syndactylus TaxID=9590 RepID=UPI003006DA30
MMAVIPMTTRGHSCPTIENGPRGGGHQPAASLLQKLKAPSASFFIKEERESRHELAIWLLSASCLGFTTSKKPLQEAV